MKPISTEEYKKLAKGRSSLEDSFLSHWRLCADPTLPQPVEQFKFCPGRKWPFDFAWPDQKLAVELQGGTLSRGAHSRGVRQEADFEKYNTAVAMGWRVLLFGTVAMQNPVDVIDFVVEVLTNAKPVEATDGTSSAG